MPGRSSSNSGSTGFISFSGIESALSSLKNFQNCINTGMDTASSVAFDLVETQSQILFLCMHVAIQLSQHCSFPNEWSWYQVETEVSSEYSMDKAMVEFAMMDRELNHYVKAVQSTINHVKEERPENIPDLKLLVEKKFLALQNKNSDADFQNNEKFVQFKQQLRELKKQLAPSHSAEGSTSERHIHGRGWHSPKYLRSRSVCLRISLDYPTSFSRPSGFPSGQNGPCTHPCPSSDPWTISRPGR
ncbi:E3 SUMO-protein ligase NSE2 isoform X5 [Myotis myotis]|uniref:E3 SUMO-protein ligase NSE2 isoform X5 n=1 Tax=Myotis myotis TaxID=51298 RepID=UPI00174D5998|nr:E3 SUMO-protein ligase NSE2 isoform X5 [Myotis myotis]